MTVTIQIQLDPESLANFIEVPEVPITPEQLESIYKDMRTLVTKLEDITFVRAGMWINQQLYTGAE